MIFVSNEIIIILFHLERSVVVLSVDFNSKNQQQQQQLRIKSVTIIKIIKKQNKEAKTIKKRGLFNNNIFCFFYEKKLISILIYLLKVNIQQQQN
jgi:hypothetical protein